MKLKTSIYFIAMFVASVWFAGFAQAGIPNARHGQKPVLDVYISTGDSHYMAHRISMDSKQIISDAFEMFKKLGVRRIYWRGMQEKTMQATLHARPANFRYYAFIQRMLYLLEDKHIERKAVRIAHDKGLQIWGVGTLGDWGCSANTPGFNDFPWFWESTLRLEHPEWVPVDKHGYRKQGGTICLAYPEARQALVDLMTKTAVNMGYDGVTLLSYVENFSQRFQDEFGYNKPIVKAFKKKYGIDIRTQPFTRYASRRDWYRLRGSYFTKYLHELSDSLHKHGIKFGMFINPRAPHKPNVWATLPQAYWTLGNIYFDINKWVREGIVDELTVMGGSSRITQGDTIHDLLFLTRNTPVEVSGVTSSPFSPTWKSLHARGVPFVMAVGGDQAFFLRSNFPDQPASVLGSGTKMQVMDALSRIIAGEITAPSKKILPYLESDNVIMRRLAVRALGVLGDPSTVPAIEKMLNDPQNGVRCVTVEALKKTYGPHSAEAIFNALNKYGGFSLYEMARSTLARIKPTPRALLLDKMDSPNKKIRNIAIRVLRLIGPHDKAVPKLIKHLHDPYRYVCYSSAMALGNVRHGKAAIDALIKTLQDPDKAIANRAARSLRQVVKRGSARSEKYAPIIFDALKARFMEFGDVYNGSDASWGYQPVGKALLVFGDKGEKTLRKFANQLQDKRLAELAWRVLSFRVHRPGENYFHLITRRQNAMAFARRPMFLKKRRSAKLKATFEGSVFDHVSSDGRVGNATALYGRWGGLGKNGSGIVDGLAHSGAQSLRMQRGGEVSTASVYITPPLGEKVLYEARMWIYRDQSDSSMLAYGVGTHPNRGNEWGFYVAPSGKVLLRDIQNKNWVDSELQVPSGQWVRLRITVSPQRHQYRISVMKEGGKEVTSDAWMATGPHRAAYLIQFSAQGSTGNVTHIDDVALLERP